MEDPGGGDDRGWHASEEVAEEGRGGEHRPGGDLAGDHGVQDLASGQPVKVSD